ncbi:MAG: transposase [Bacteroidota bacterium]
MSEYLKTEEGKPYFVTFTIVEWIDLFTRECFVNILLDSIRHCQQHKGLEVYAYVIMPSHVHMIARCDGKLSNILRDMKEHTSKMIIRELIHNPQESRREWLLEKFTMSGDKEKKQYRVWQPGNHPEELYSDKFINQKENYIHMNPVEAGIVGKPEYYRLSSASEESPINVLSLR